MIMIVMQYNNTSIIFIPLLWKIGDMLDLDGPSFCPYIGPSSRNILVSTQYLENTMIELILISSRLRLLPVIFRKFVTDICPSIDIRFSFLLNILRTKGWNFIKYI